VNYRSPIFSNPMNRYRTNQSNTVTCPCADCSQQVPWLKLLACFAAIAAALLWWLA
jgi:hypothetical protein